MAVEAAHAERELGIAVAKLGGPSPYRSCLLQNHIATLAAPTPSSEKSDADLSVCVASGTGNARRHMCTRACVCVLVHVRLRV